MRIGIGCLLLLFAGDVEARSSELERLEAAFQAQTGARLVFDAADLPDGEWFEIAPSLPPTRQLAAARIALAEVSRYPKGYLGEIGLGEVGIFAGLASSQDDGFHQWDPGLGGYAYYGLWNGRDALEAAFYTSDQLPLTLHHEIFHHVDATVDGVTSDAALTGDDARFAAALDGTQPYPAAPIADADLALLRAAGTGAVLEVAVSDYAAKNPGEDQAETARWMWSHLPDALVQVATHPELAGSQRLLHVIDQYAHSAAIAPDLAWLVEVAAGGRATRLARTAARLEQLLADRIAPAGAFRVWGREDAHGVNQTLRGDLARFGAVARALTREARDVTGASAIVDASVARDLELLVRYHDFIAARWTISDGTERSFARARAALVATALPPDNPYLGNVDAEIADPDERAAIRRVQPATVKLGGGSGVNLDAAGVFLTAGHVAKAIGAELTVRFPDGTEVPSVTVAYDEVLDVAVLVPKAPAHDLPWAPLARSAPAVGDPVVVIGQPGAYTPDHQPTNYQPWTVSTGAIRGFDGAPLDDQRMGGVEHDAWTYWGHSGSPLFDVHGRIVAMHNSWDSTTGMRHAVRYQAIRKVLDDAGLAYHLAT